MLQLEPFTYFSLFEFVVMKEMVTYTYMSCYKVELKCKFKSV